MALTVPLHEILQNFDFMRKDDNTLRTKRKTSAELSELKKSIAAMSDERREIAGNLLTEVLFLDSTLSDLQTAITKDGPLIKTTRGQTEVTKENPALRAYNTSISRYCQLIKQLTDLLPKPMEVQPADPLIDFITGKKQ